MKKINKIAALFWKIGVFILFLLVLLLNFNVVKFFAEEQRSSINTHNLNQFRRIAQHLRQDVTEGEGATGGLGKIDRDSVTRQLDDALKSEDTKQMKKILDDVIAYMKDKGAKEEHLNKYEKEKGEAEKAIRITLWGSKISYGIYFVIFFIVGLSFVQIVCCSPRRSKSKAREIINEFNTWLLSPSLIASLNPISYYKELANEADAGEGIKVNVLLNHLTNMGLLGTLFGLALAFYTAASSFPLDIEHALETGENKTMVITGLIQTIYNYSFAVITSLVAYSLAMCLRIINNASRVSISKLFGDNAFKLIRSASIPVGALAGDIEKTVERMVEQAKVKEHIEEALIGVNSYITGMSEAVEEEIKETRRKFDELTKSTQTATEENKTLLKRIKQLEEELMKLTAASAVLRNKIDNLVTEMRK